jgi:hypothetical protein
VPVFGDFLADQRIQVGQFPVRGDDFLCEGGDQLPEVPAGAAVCWDFAASTAAWATAADERAPCFFSHAWSLAWPVRRIPSGVRCLVSSNRAALERLQSKVLSSAGKYSSSWTCRRLRCGGRSGPGM